MKQVSRSIRIYGVFLAGLSVAAIIFWLSLFPDHYFFTSETERLSWQWNFGKVSTSILFVLGEVAAYYAIVRPWSFDGSKLRLITAIACFLPWANVLLLGIEHSPSYHIVHICWLFVLIVGLLLALVYLLIRGVVLQLRGQS